MTEWTRKRFWKTVSVLETEGGYSIALDGRPVRTPSKSLLVLPTRALAEDMAREWEAQGNVIDPLTMPVTRMSNSSIDKVVAQRTEVIDHLLRYGETDLLCYRAEAPESLVAEQSAAWDPWLDWAEAALGVRLETTQGILPIAQDPQAIDALRARIDEFSNFELSAFHDLVTLPGSLILGFAAAFRADAPEALWRAARTDELWQISQWGADEEAERVNQLKRDAFVFAARYFARAR